MKAHRYLHPDRHLDQDTDDTMMNPNDPESPADATAAPQALAVDVGKPMPPVLPDQLPMLHTGLQGQESADGPARSLVAEGMHFVGHALLSGPCSVAGQFDGNLTQADGASVAVVVTETGRVKGDITAQKISVMGRTEGILDAGQGEVALHDTASVHGLVRYGRIQVNGADLNATLERVPLTKSGT